LIKLKKGVGLSERINFSLREPPPKGGGFLFVGIGNGTNLTRGILSGKKVYDIYCGGGKSRQNSTPKKNKVGGNDFFYMRWLCIMISLLYLYSLKPNLL